MVIIVYQTIGPGVAQKAKLAGTPYFTITVNDIFKFEHINVDILLGNVTSCGFSTPVIIFYFSFKTGITMGEQLFEKITVLHFMLLSPDFMPLCVGFLHMTFKDPYEH